MNNYRYFIFLIIFTIANNGRATLDELEKLLILQKDYQIAKKNNDLDKQKPYLDYIAPLIKDIDSEEISVQGEQGHQISSIIYRPKGQKGPAPTAIHVHGGPHVHMSKDLTHAEIIYLVKTLDFVVIAPNYRGSTGYGSAYEDPTKYSNEYLYQYAPKDVLDVTKYAVENLPYVDKSRILLRGGSFGSHVNAQVLNDTSLDIQDVYKGIKGVHLSGGLYYFPMSSDRADNLQHHRRLWPIYQVQNIPPRMNVFISHGLKDDTAPADQSITYMKALLNADKHVQTFISYSGDHHLIDPSITTEQESPGRTEFREYLKKWLSFVEAIKDDLPYQVQSKEEQVYWLSKAEDALYGRETQTEPDRAKLALAKALSSRIAKNFSAYSDEVQKRSLIGSYKDDYLGPSRAYLKLVLGKDHSGVLETDLRAFFSNHFLPKTPEEKMVVPPAGEQVLRDDAFFNEVVKALRLEGAHMAKAADSYPLYHATDASGVHLYLFQSIAKEFLTLIPSLGALFGLRSFETDFAPYLSAVGSVPIDSFYCEMKKRKSIESGSQALNNVPGFAECAIAANFSLLGNHLYTASNTLWWWFMSSAARTAPVESVMRRFFALFDILSQDRIKRYLDVMDDFATDKDGALLQIFLPKKRLDDLALITEMWGEPVLLEGLKTREALKPSQLISSLQSDPIKYEEMLENQESVFKNPNKRSMYGAKDKDKGFLFAEPLQLRVFSPPSLMKDAKIYTYPRSLERFAELRKRLIELFAEDMALILAKGEQSKRLEKLMGERADLTDIFNRITTMAGATKKPSKIPGAQIAERIAARDFDALKEWYDSYGDEADMNRKIGDKDGKRLSPLMRFLKAIALGSTLEDNIKAKLSIEPYKQTDFIISPDAKKWLRWLIENGADVNEHEAATRAVNAILYKPEYQEEPFICRALRRDDQDLALAWATRSAKNGFPLHDLGQCTFYRDEENLELFPSSIDIVKGLEMMRKIVRSGVIDPNRRDKDGMTALESLISHNNKGLVEPLLALGIKPDSASLVRAINEKSQYLLELLVGKGARLNDEQEQTILPKSPLRFSYARASNKPNVILNGDSILYDALFSGLGSTAQALLEAGATIDSITKNSVGYKPIHAVILGALKAQEDDPALWLGLFETMQKANGFEVNAQTKQGGTAWHIIALRGDSRHPNTITSFIDKLKELKADATIKNINGKSPLDIIDERIAKAGPAAKERLTQIRELIEKAQKPL